MENKIKTIFIDRLDGDSCVCPFLGYNISNLEEFASVIKKYFTKEKGYPGLVISTKYRNVSLVFAGHQYKHGSEGRWCIVDKNTPSKNWFDLKANWNEVYNLLKDKKELDKQVAVFKTIVKQNNGIVINV